MLVGSLIAAGTGRHRCCATAQPRLPPPVRDRGSSTPTTTAYPTSSRRTAQGPVIRVGSSAPSTDGRVIAPTSATLVPAPRPPRRAGCAPPPSGRRPRGPTRRGRRSGSLVRSLGSSSATVLPSSGVAHVVDEVVVDHPGQGRGRRGCSSGIISRRTCEPGSTATGRSSSSTTIRPGRSCSVSSRAASTAPVSGPPSGTASRASRAFTATTLSHSLADVDRRDG